MKFTKIKIDGVKPTEGQLQTLITDLVRALSNKGYITEGSIVNSTSIKLGLHMRSFSIDVQVLGYNTRFSPYIPERRTNVPCWDQRVDYNNTVNAILDKHKVSSKVTSGPFTIRDGLDHYTENQWLHQDQGYGPDIRQGLHGKLLKKANRKKIIKWIKGETNDLQA